ncbi:MAG: TMEM43 family protein, partial [Thermodesulfobacteriota bacterium]|nr:TMEM43 family protein [Thermodesulfobacteriota bacterium]
KKVTTYKYSKVWSTRLIRSSGFKRSGGHRNPGSMPFKSREIKAGKVKVDAFILSKGLVDKIKSYEQFRVDESKGLPVALQSSGQRYDGGYYVGDNPSSPKIGDLKITFDIVKPTIVSLVAGQIKNTFTPYNTDIGGAIELLQTGKHSARDMFKSAQRQNILLTWGIRIGGLLLMYLGLFMMLRPLSVVADVIPLFGNIIGMGAGIVSFLIAALFGITIISIAWIVYRPLLGFSLLTAMLILVVFIFVRRFRKKVSSPPPPPPASEMAKFQTTTMPPPHPSPPPPPVKGDLTKENVPGLAIEEWILTGKKEFGAKNYKNALDAFSMAIESNPKLAVAYYNRGVVYDKIGNKESAISDLKVAASLGHKNAQHILESKKLV